MKKLISTLLTAVLLFGASGSQVFASSTASPGQATSNAILDASAMRLDVTVPTSVLIYVDATGTVITPDSIPVVNNSVAPILVTSLAVTAEDGWTLDTFTTDYKNFKVGRKNFKMTLNGLDPSGGALSFPTPINGSSSLALDFLADVSPQKEAITATKIGEIIITVDWYADAIPVVPPEGGETGGSYPAGYVLATDADFIGDTTFRYVGTADYVVIPNTIKGVAVTSYQQMFYNSAVKGVISNNPNINDMRFMFENSATSSLELDLNISGMPSTIAMFSGATITEGYAATQAQADIFNASIDKPAGLTFSVK